MSDTVKKPQQNPASYSPKIPEIVSRMKQAGMELSELPAQYMIEGVFPTGNTPWTGGCDFLRCFASLYMHLEGMPPEQDTRYGLYRKFLVVSGMGMVTTFSEDLDKNNYSFEAAHDYIGRLHRFVGYDYGVIEVAGRAKNEVFQVISNSIYHGHPVLAAYADGANRFQHAWKLFTGYHRDEETLVVNEDETVSAEPNWFRDLNRVIIITQTTLPKPDMKDVLLEIIHDAERNETQGEAYGYAAYETLISRLKDDAFFCNADDAALETFNGAGALGSFFWYHAEARGAVGEGCGELCAAELKGTEYETDFSCNGFYGYNGHQTSYIGCMAIRKGAHALREKAHREVLIYCLRQLMSNDAKMIKMIKMAVGIDTPDVLSPKDAAGNPVDYCLRSKDMLMWKSPVDNISKMAIFSSSDSMKTVPLKESYPQYQELITEKYVLSRCVLAREHQIDLKKQVKAVGKIKHRTSGRAISIKTGDSIYETKGLMQTKQTFSAPLKIDACIENKDTAFLLSFHACIEDKPTWLSFNGGYMKNSSWSRQPGKILTWDIAVDYCMDFNTELPAVDTPDIHISWILQRDFMAVIVNGVLTHYSENFPYMHFDLPTAPVGFSAFDKQTVVVKSLSVSELE